MTRWKREFEQHPFKQVWADLMLEAGKLEVDDTTVVEAVEEAARLKKALAFIDKIISHVDLELIPGQCGAIAKARPRLALTRFAVSQPAGA